MVNFLFWFFSSVIIFTYFGYPLLLIIISVFRKNQAQKANFFPTVSIIIAVHNEEKVLKRRIENLLNLQYPKQKIEIIIASDGSTDRTNEIAKSYSNKGVTLVVSESQKGKSAIQNMAVSQTKGEIILFSDADTLFKTNFLKKLVPNFFNHRVGCVTGKVIWKNLEDTSVSKFAGSYWEYESFLRYVESKLGILHAASGQCIAVRKRIFKPIVEFAGEDIVIPLDCILSGYKVVYEPEAMAYDTLVSSVGGEFSWRSRTATRTIRGILSKKQLLNPFRYPSIAVTIIFHPLLRYFVPFLLILTFICNIFLLNSCFYKILFAFQVIFYSFAIIGYFLNTKRIKIKVFAYPFSFCFAHLAFMVGTIRAIMGKDIIAYRSVE